MKTIDTVDEVVSVKVKRAVVKMNVDTATFLYTAMEKTNKTVDELLLELLLPILEEKDDGESKHSVDG